MLGLVPRRVCFRKQKSVRIIHEVNSPVSYHIKIVSSASLFVFEKEFVEVEDGTNRIFILLKINVCSRGKHLYLKRAVILVGLIKYKDC